jgi:hypothetical protein
MKVDLSVLARHLDAVVLRESSREIVEIACAIAPIEMA